MVDAVYSDRRFTRAEPDAALPGQFRWGCFNGCARRRSTHPSHRPSPFRLTAPVGWPSLPGSEAFSG